MNVTEALASIELLFDTYAPTVPPNPGAITALTDGKLYELYVLSRVIDDLVNRGCVVTFVGTHLAFKAGPGMIKTSDPHFEIQVPSGHLFRLFVDIEFKTLGSSHVPVTDKSDTHELDIVIVRGILQPYPSHDQIVLGVECKAGKFSKALLKQVLGVRREMAYVSEENPSWLTLHGASPPEMVAAQPPSEFWVAHLDPAGSNYAESPRAFGINFRHIEP